MASAELSVVLVNKFGFDRLHRIFESLAEQSIADRLELVIVSPFDPPDGEQSPFAKVQYVKYGPIDCLGRPRAAGVQACSAPYLVFGEDHCFPRPGWAAALLSRLREGWTGVGPAIVNNNPFTWISRADWLLNYGYFSPACRRGPVSYIPPHNSAYPTAVLQALGSTCLVFYKWTIIFRHVCSRTAAGCFSNHRPSPNTPTFRVRWRIGCLNFMAAGYTELLGRRFIVGQLRAGGFMPPLSR